MISNRIPRRGAAGLCGAAVVVLLSTFACGGYAAPTTLAESTTLEQLDAFAGGEAERCVFSAPNHQLCTWLVRDTAPGFGVLSQMTGSTAELNLVCELPIDGGTRAENSCMAHPRATQSFARTGELPPVGAAGARESAETALATATTVVSLSHLLGDAPDRCRTGPGFQTCQWIIQIGEPGYDRISAISEAGESIVLECELPLDGSARQGDSCTAS